MRRTGYSLSLVCLLTGMSGPFLVGCDGSEPEQLSAVDGGRGAIEGSMVSPQVASTVRACDILLRGVAQPNVVFADSVVGHWSQRGNDFALAFLAKSDSALVSPFTWSGDFKEKSTSCYDEAGAQLPESVIVWP